MTRRAKIVCTLGPATNTPERVRALVDAGMDVARLNLSHGTHADHAAAYRAVREASDAAGRAVGILADLQGPKIRLGSFPTGPVYLAEGAQFILGGQDTPGDVHHVGTSYPTLAEDVRVGQQILVDDGRVVLEVKAIDGTDVVTTVRVAGTVSDHKGLNLPDTIVTLPVLGEKDRADLKFALSLPVDLVALSFVRSPKDVLVVREVMQEVGRRAPVLAKIEKPQALDELSEIVRVFDGIMVARGDLGVELPLEDVPLVQKHAVTLARTMAKPVIVATQMLESMIGAPRPTRAEVSDVANAVLDGADAVMLSAETGVGAYPIETVQTMARVVAYTEDHGLHRIQALEPVPLTRSGAIAEAAAHVGRQLDAKYLVAFSQSGDTARRLARYRSPIPLLAFTPDPAVRSQLALVWGVETFLVDFVRHTDDMVRQVDAALTAANRCSPGDLVIIVAGTPSGMAGTTNLLRAHRIGDLT